MKFQNRLCGYILRYFDFASPKLKIQSSDNWYLFGMLSHICSQEKLMDIGFVLCTWWTMWIPRTGIYQLLLLCDNRNGCQHSTGHASTYRTGIYQYTPIQQAFTIFGPLLMEPMGRRLRYSTVHCTHTFPKRNMWKWYLQSHDMFRGDRTTVLLKECAKLFWASSK